MTFAMVSLSKHPKSGSWTARKSIPADVRGAYRSPYDDKPKWEENKPKWEEKKTWPAALSKGQAKAELAAWLVPIEERIEELRQKALYDRALQTSEPQALMTLSKRQARALAGEWYEAKRIEYEDNPGHAANWENGWDDLVPDDEEEREAGRVRPTDWLISERDTLLKSKRLAVRPASADGLLQEMGDLWIELCRLMERRSRGDYGPDPLAETLPAFETAPRKPSVSASITQLFEDYASTDTAAPATVKKWRPVIRQFVEHLGHDDAARVTTADIGDWVKVLLAKPLSVKSVRDGYLPAVKIVLDDAAAQRHIPSNPALGVKVRGPKPVQTRGKGLTDAEAATILKAALGPHPKALSKGHALARRWVPWVCAYTGARVNEITQLRAGDIRQEGGVWVIHITPEAGSVKDRKARSVPIHSHLIEQGFHQLGKKGDVTPLFYDPAAHRGGSEGNPQYKKIGERLAKWVRSLGIEGVAPNHGWRHRLKTEGRRAGIPAGYLAVIQGHALDSVAENYGDWPLESVRAEVEKLPRYVT